MNSLLQISLLVVLFTYQTEMFKLIQNKVFVSSIVSSIILEVQLKKQHFLLSLFFVNFLVVWLVFLVHFDVGKKNDLVS